MGVGLHGATATAVFTVVSLAAAPASAAQPSAMMTTTVASSAAVVSASAKACKTSRKKIVRDLRKENAYPVVQGMRRRDITACRGRWVVVTRDFEGDASFNARYRRGKWHYYVGYPMGSCRGVPGWLCPSHP